MRAVRAGRQGMAGAGSLGFCRMSHAKRGGGDEEAGVP